jgi:hypothetical protein
LKRKRRIGTCRTWEGTAYTGECNTKSEAKIKTITPRVRECRHPPEEETRKEASPPPRVCFCQHLGFIPPASRSVKEYISVV